MSMSLKVKGLDEYMAALNSLGADTEKIVAEAMYDGAAILIEECKKNIQALPVEDGYMQPGIKRNCVTTSEKDDLLKSIGIARYTKKGDKISTAIGFQSGYSSHKTKKYPNGVPIPLIARSVESGSSVRVKHPFMRTAVNSTKDRIATLMAEKLHDEIAKKMEG